MRNTCFLVMLGGAFFAGALGVGIVVLPVRGGGAASPATRNGDVNGDGTIDIGDCVYLLLYLFRSGDPLAPLADPPELVARVGELETALAACEKQLTASQEALMNAESSLAMCQKEVTDSRSLLEQCKGELEPCRARLKRGLFPATGELDVFGDCPGQDGQYRTGCPMESRFTYNLDGTVTDACTGLMWKRETVDINLDGIISGMDRVNWCTALQFCENFIFAGFDDWRLPNIRELQSLADYGRVVPGGGGLPPLNGIFSVESGSGDFYWSSTTIPSVPSAVWTYEGNASKTEALGYVRSVRGP